MSDSPLTRAPKFRLVFELTLPDGDPWSPRGYPELLKKLTEVLAGNGEVRCKDVLLREALTIGDKDDYDDWRSHQGAYDPTQWSETPRG